jgi:predicted nucleic acid-binding protein
LRGTFVGMIRVVMDSNGLDPIIDRPGAIGAVREAVESGRLTMYVTHVQQTEVAKTPDLQRRRLLEGVLDLAEQRPVGVFVFGAGRFGDRFGADDGSYERITRDKPGKHAHDAMIALTARMDDCALVTADRKLRTTASAENIRVLSPDDFLRNIGYRNPGPRQDRGAG